MHNKSINFSTLEPIQIQILPGYRERHTWQQTDVNGQTYQTFSKDLESTQVPSGSNVHSFGNEALVTGHHQRTLISNIKTDLSMLTNFQNASNLGQFSPVKRPPGFNSVNNGVSGNTGGTELLFR